MSNIPEKNEYPVYIPLIEEGDEVKGGIDGDSNKQAINLTNRTNFLKIQHELLALKVGQLTPRDIGAEVAGSAASVMGGHVADPDPHNQYLLKDDAGAIFVELSGANLPGGYVKLNESGKIPASLIDMIQSSYIVVADKAARLALPQSANLTICVQVDVDTLFYLNGNLNPSVESNWFSGQSATVSGVSRVFGRTGDVTAQAGDYTADQITETTNRRFLTTAEKAAYAAKQDKLVSGTNIRTLFGKNLLGSADLVLTPQELGAAPTIHTHSVAEINDWSTKFSEQLSAKLKPGRGIAIGYNSSTGEVTIDSATGGAGGDGGKPFITAERLAATAGQLHIFNFAANNLFDLDAYALKSEAGATNQAQLIDTFLAGSSGGYNKTDDLTFNGLLQPTLITRNVMSADNGLFSVVSNPVGKDIVYSVPTGSSSIIPAMTSDTAPAGYTASASSIYTTDFLAYKAFDAVAGKSDWCSSNSTVTDPLPWLRIDMPSKRAISSYRLTRQSTDVNFFMKSWKLQGMNPDMASWDDIHTVTNNTLTAQTMTFDIGKVVSYQSYRILTVELTAPTTPVQIREFELLAPTGVFILNMGGKNYTVTGGNLVEITEAITPAVIASKGIPSTGKLTISNLTLPVKIISDKQLEVVSTKSPFSQIAIQKTLTNGSRWDKIKSGTLTGAEVGAGKVRLAFSRDLTTWWSFVGGVLTNIGTLTADKAGAEKLISTGGTRTEFNAMTEANWKTFYGDRNGQPDKIAFAFAFDVPNSAVDNANLDQLTLTVDLAASWKKQTEAEVEIRWYTDSVSFKTVTAGDYRLGYQIP